jgi:hypothetical protein
MFRRGSRRNEMNMEVTGAAPEGSSTKSRSTKKAGSKSAGSKAKPKKSAKATPGLKKTKATRAPQSERVTKTAVVLDLLRQWDGATIADIARVTGWQHHSIRGFLSGTITKKLQLNLKSSKNEAGERSNRLE